MAQLPIDGTTLEYAERGKGEPLVLVHGSASDYRTWHLQQDEFAKRFRTVAYSRRYHWPNEAIPEGADYAMAQHVDDLLSLLSALDAAPAHMVGHSYGGLVALLLAMQAPQSVRTLVLCEPPVITLFVSNTPTPVEILTLLLHRLRIAAAILQFGVTGAGPATAAVGRGDMDAAMRLFGTATLGASAYGALSESRREQVRANLIKAEFLGSGLPPLEAQRIREVRVPTLLITGQSSRRLFYYLLDKLERLLPNAQRRDIPGASHIVHEDKPAAYHAAVLSFLARYH
jgi:pimeloyl-ACP methyl ester carboxylesterase